MARILFIDDDPDILDAVSRLLEVDRHTVTGAPSGTQGIQLAQTQPFDLILCDINMPLVDGFAVFEAIKKDPKASIIPFVFITARGARPDQRQGMELGADDYLIKPFSTKELLSCVRAQLAKRTQIVDRYETTLRMVRKNIIYALPHELRTPLSHIIGYAGLIEMEDEPVLATTAKEYGREITRASARLEHLIENYLVYAQIEVAASSPDELAKLRNHIVKNAVPVIEKSVNERAEHYKRKKDVELHLTPYALRISESDLGKIVSELVDNACKFSAAGSAIVVKSEKTETAYQICITDKGRGMSAEQIALLDAYMQFDRAFYEQQGVGLGFIIAKRLTELHGGKICIESKSQEGTTICVSFAI